VGINWFLYHTSLNMYAGLGDTAKSTLQNITEAFIMIINIIMILVKPVIVT